MKKNKKQNSKVEISGQQSLIRKITMSSPRRIQLLSAALSFFSCIIDRIKIMRIRWCIFPAHLQTMLFLIPSWWIELSYIQKHTFYKVPVTLTLNQYFFNPFIHKKTFVGFLRKSRCDFPDISNGIDMISHNKGPKTTAFSCFTVRNRVRVKLWH